MSKTYFNCSTTDGEVEVLSCVEKENAFFVELRENPFYPDGKGGQLGDRGSVGSANVMFVEENGVLVDRKLGKGKYKVKIDLERRKEIARQHTAQHIFSAAVEKLFKVKTVGFHMGEEDTTVDLERSVDLKKAVELSNDVIMSDLKVEELLVSAQEAKKYELRKSLSKKALESEKVRLIKIGDFDLSACGGFHVSRTGEIGSLRVIYSERVKSDLQRVWFVAGKRALEDCEAKEEALFESARYFDASWKDLKRRIERLSEKFKSSRNELKKMAALLAAYISESVSANSFLELDELTASFVIKRRQDVPYVIRFSPFDAFVCIPNVGKDEVMSWTREKGFKGGGRGPVYRFRFQNFEEFKEEFEKLMKHENS